MVTTYVVLVALVAVERLVELVVSTRNARWAFAAGGVERGKGHYPVMVLVHVGLLVGCVVETTVGDARPTLALAVPMLLLVLAAQGLRWWCIGTLGRQWNTRVIVVPGLPLVRRGPYRYLRHPNYVAVVVEGIALPLVGSAWITAVVFTVANAFLLRTRIRCEDAALSELAAPPEPEPHAPVDTRETSA
jgi:methyltransferase